MAEHFEILGDVLAGSAAVLKRGNQAHTLDGRLRDAAQRRGRFDAERVQHRRHHVNGMGVLRPHLPPGLDAFGPGEEERVARAAPVGLPLPAAEGGIAGMGPPPRKMVERRRAADLVDVLEAVFHRVRDVVEEAALVDRAGRPAFRARSVVRDEHDERILVLPHLLEECDQLADIVVGVFEEPGEHFHHAGVEPALIGREAVPVLHVRVMAGKLGIRRDDAHLLLPLEHFLAVGVPAAVELALVFVRPFFGHMVGRVHRAQRKVHKERLVRGDLLGVGDKRLRLFHQVGRQVIALLRRLFRFHLMVVGHQLGYH